MKIKEWTRNEEIRLAGLLPRFTVKDCAFILGRTFKSVHQKKQQLGVYAGKPYAKRRVFYAENIACIFELISLGFNCAEIAKCFNTKKETIVRAVNNAKKHGFDEYPKLKD